MAVESLDTLSNRDRPAVERVAVPIIYAAVGGVFLWILILVNIRISHGHSGDFRHFYYAARAMRFGQNPYAEGTGALAPSVVVTRDESRASTGGYLYPPLIAFLYLPVSGLTPHTAERVVLVVNMLCAIAGLLIVGREYCDRLARPDPLLLAGVTLLAVLLDVDKVRGELQMFQTNSLMFLMFAVSLRWLDRRPWLAGVPLGVILDIKYLSLAMIPWLIVRRRYRTAGGTVVSAVAFSLLPAVVSGWNTNLRDLGIAYGGLATMMGIGEKTASATSQANVEDLKNWLSVSITSSMARMSYFTGHSQNAGLALAGVVVAIALAVVIWLYRRNRVRLFIWPAARLQWQTPWRQTIGYEFASVLIATLCFSPQTNTRHLLLVLVMTAPLSVLILNARPKARGVATAIAAGFMFFTFVWPGGEQIEGKNRLGLMWAGVGAPSWGMLAAMLTMISVGMSQLSQDVRPGSLKLRVENPRVSTPKAE